MSRGDAETPGAKVISPLIWVLLLSGGFCAVMRTQRLKRAQHIGRSMSGTRSPHCGQYLTPPLLCFVRILAPQDSFLQILYFGQSSAC